MALLGVLQARFEFFLRLQRKLANAQHLSGTRKTTRFLHFLQMRDFCASYFRNLAALLAILYDQFCSSRAKNSNKFPPPLHDRILDPPLVAPLENALAP